MYNNYEKFLLAGDFNTEDEHEALTTFLSEQNAKKLVKEKTCFKSIKNPSRIDLLVTNAPLSFQGTTTLSVGLSGFHKRQ